LSEAARALHTGLTRIREAHGPDAILFLASPRVSTEAAWLFASLGQREGTRFVFPAEDLRRDALPDVSGLSGYNISTAKQGDVLGADVVMTVGADVCAYTPVFEWKLRRAQQNGAIWIHIGPVPTAWKRLVGVHVDCRAGEEAAALSAICGIVVAKGLSDTQHMAAAANAEAFVSHAFAEPPSGADEAAGFVGDTSKKVVIVINQDAAVGSDGADVRWAADLALLTGRTGGERGGLLVVKNEANGQGVQDVIYGGGFATSADLARAKTQLRAGKIRAVVLLGVDPVGLAGLETDLAHVEFTAAIDLFPTAATERAEVVVPLTPLQEEDGSLVSFDGRVTMFKKVFKPLTGFSSVEFLSEVFAEAGGTRPDLAAIRQQIAAALPLYQSLTSASGAAYLCDEAARGVGAPRFAMALLSSARRGGAYQSATTFSRVAEARVQASLEGSPVAAPCETR
jgi:predicted molibdopterin-dependent oxidoreductase YjgC